MVPPLRQRPGGAADDARSKAQPGGPCLMDGEQTPDWPRCGCVRCGALRVRDQSLASAKRHWLKVSRCRSEATANCCPALAAGHAPLLVLALGESPVAGPAGSHPRCAIRLRPDLGRHPHSRSGRPCSVSVLRSTLNYTSVIRVGVSGFPPQATTGRRWRGHPHVEHKLCRQGIVKSGFHAPWSNGALGSLQARARTPRGHLGRRLRPGCSGPAPRRCARAVADCPSARFGGTRHA